MIALGQGSVVLKKHGRGWAEDAQVAMNRLKRVFGSKIVDVQHVGTTSIRGLKALPIIDIVAGVKDFRDAYLVLRDLEEHGFSHEKECDNENQMVFGCYDFEGILTHRIYVILYDSNEWDRVVRFRDMLSEDRNIREEYEALRMKMAKEHGDDATAYSMAKKDFIDSILSAC